MATLLELRRRVRSVKNIRQITRAMKMVAAAKLRRTQDRIIAARPYSDKVWEVLNDLAGRTERRRHALLQTRDEQHVTLLVITSDRSFCGAFNTNVVRRTHAALRGFEDKAVSLALVGKNGITHFDKRDWHIDRRYPDYISDIDFPKAAAIARHLTDRFVEGATDAVYMVYNEFKSVLQQDVVIEPLLPVVGIRFEREDVGTAREAARALAEAKAGLRSFAGVEAMGTLAEAWAAGAKAAAEADELEPVELVDYLYEPDADVIYEALLPRHVETQVFRASMESLAAEHAARMTAMENATKNADEMIEDLTLTMNKIRQEEITTEILEVVGGAEALE